MKSTERQDVRGLASADEITRKKVGQQGGEAPHKLRGLQAASSETRRRVATAGGRASRGGGRKSANESLQGKFI